MCYNGCKEHDTRKGSLGGQKRPTEALVSSMNNNQDYTPGNDSFFYDSSAPEMNPVPENTGHAAGYATAALWLGIVGLFLCFCCCCLYYLALPLGILGIVFACLSRRDNGRVMTTKATVALILCILAILICVLFLVTEIVMIATMTPEDWRELIDQSMMETYGMTFQEYMEAVANGEIVE